MIIVKGLGDTERDASSGEEGVDLLESVEPDVRFTSCKYCCDLEKYEAFYGEERSHLEIRSHPGRVKFCLTCVCTGGLFCGALSIDRILLQKDGSGTIRNSSFCCCTTSVCKRERHLEGVRAVNVITLRARGGEGSLHPYFVDREGTKWWKFSSFCGPLSGRGPKMNAAVHLMREYMSSPPYATELLRRVPEPQVSASSTSSRPSRSPPWDLPPEEMSLALLRQRSTTQSADTGALAARILMYMQKYGSKEGKYSMMVGECITADYAGDTNSCAIAQHALEKCVSGASIRDANMDAKQGRLTIPWGLITPALEEELEVSLLEAKMEFMRELGLSTGVEEELLAALKLRNARIRRALQNPIF